MAAPRGGRGPGAEGPGSGLSRSPSQADELPRSGSSASVGWSSSKDSKQGLLRSGKAWAGLGKGEGARRLVSSLVLLLGCAGGWLLRDFAAFWVCAAGSHARSTSLPDMAAVALASSDVGMATALAHMGQGPPGDRIPREAAAVVAAQERQRQREQHMRELVEEVRRHAPARVRDKCVAMVSGSRLDSFGQGFQDWVLFHTLYSHLKYGEGFYVDAGANHPEKDSNSFFFDACLGWKGLCIEPNPVYRADYARLRSCKLVQNCVAGVEGDMVLTNNMTKGVVRSAAKGVQGLTVRCRRLQDILAEAQVGQAGQRRIDLVSMDVEGKEREALRCFPFDAFDAPVWLIETLHVNRRLLQENIMGRAGFWMSPGLASARLNLRLRVGVLQDNVFVRWQRPSAHPGGPSAYDGLVPALALGPDFLPGRPLEGHAFLPSCAQGQDCPQQIPSTDAWYEFKGGKFMQGECPPFAGIRHRLSVAH